MIALSLFKLAEASTCTTVTKGGITPGLYDGLCNNGTDIFSSLSDIWIIIANVVRILVALGGVFAVIFIIVGGLFYVTSAGSPTRITRAKEILKESITGLIIILIAYSAITFIAGKF